MYHRATGMLYKYSNYYFIFLLSKIGLNTELAAAILAANCVALSIRRLSLIRLAIVKNKLLNSFASSSDSRKVITKFDYNCASNINCQEVRSKL